jgi:predicted nucleotide-binding protein (sugar kinase/HSP70/actin superfamily)
MKALLSGNYDLNHVAVAITQTGGGCRATNYIGFIRRALGNAGMSQIPVISISAQGIEKNPGLHYTIPLLKAAMQSLVYGDVFMRVLYATRPYELVPGSANALHEKWQKICIDSMNGKNKNKFNYIREIIHHRKNICPTNIMENIS